MDKIEKLFRRITKKERGILKIALVKLMSGKSDDLDIKKIKSSEYYRLRVGNFRVIFHTDNASIIVDDVRLRNEGTYKNL